MLFGTPAMQQFVAECGLQVARFVNIQSSLVSNCDCPFKRFVAEPDYRSW
jgi:hypothetical protein